MHLWSMQIGDAKYAICTISQDASNCVSLHVPSNKNVPMLFFFSEEGTHHLMLSDLFFSRLTDNGQQWCLPRLDWVETEKWKSIKNRKCVKDLRRPTGALSGRWLKLQICTLFLLHYRHSLNQSLILASDGVRGHTRPSGSIQGWIKHVLTCAPSWDTWHAWHELGITL